MREGSFDEPGEVDKANAGKFVEGGAGKNKLRGRRKAALPDLLAKLRCVRIRHRENL